MAGFGTRFQSRANQYGATANKNGEGQIPSRLFNTPLPAVSSNFGYKSEELYTNSLHHQVSPTRQSLGWATLLPRLGRLPTKGENARNTDNTTADMGEHLFPSTET